jgi:hypothetical protein
VCEREREREREKERVYVVVAQRGWGELGRGEIEGKRGREGRGVWGSRATRAG